VNDYANRPVLVLGLGASGEAAARLLSRLGARVTVADAGASPALEARAAPLRAAGCVVCMGPASLPGGSFDFCVTSPGIPADHEWVRRVAGRGIPVIGELELGWRHRRSRLLAVTGSNGKSTLVKLCREALAAAGAGAVAGGNYGQPLSALVQLEPAPDWLVVEVSSFQLETVEGFRPDVGILLNLNPNHLDRHGTMEVYAAMKARLFARMGAAQTAVIPLDAPAGVRAALPAGCRVRTFGLAPAADFRYERGGIAGASLPAPVSVAGSAFDNEVMGLTAAACVAALEGSGMDTGAVTRAAARFEPLPHRMQPVGERDGVCFVNDSKATNLAAMTAALRMTSRPVRLIAGGLLKEKDLEPVKKVLANRVRGVYIIGKYSQVMADAWREGVPCHECGTLREATRRAAAEAQPGELVLLSPGCASFDQFSGFEDRGAQFSRMVEEIIKGGSS
jgi:UDP-N-acetylmuramoylalanine--D-glutamate ligase